MPAFQNLIIINAGNFGREVLVWARQAIRAGAPWHIKGFLDSRSDELGSLVHGVPILAAPEIYIPDSNDVFLCALGEPTLKYKYVSMMEEKGAVFCTLIHPTALIGENVDIKTGVILCPFTQLSCEIKIGPHVTIGTMSSVAHNTVIGAYSQLSGGCQINGHAHLGEEVFVGSGAIILPKARVGDRAYVGAGSVVLKRVKPYTKVFGNPAVQIALVE